MKDQLLRAEVSKGSTENRVQCVTKESRCDQNRSTRGAVNPSSPEDLKYSLPQSRVTYQHFLHNTPQNYSSG